SVVRSGLSPLTFVGTTGATYSVAVSDYGSIFFDHWENGSTARTRTLTLNADTAITAHYRDTAPLPPPMPDPDPSSIADLIPKTGVFVALYMYPGGTQAAHWQKVIDEKTKHPSVPIVAAFNPSSGPGNFKDNNIASWVNKLKQAGVIAIGYTYDDYGTRSLAALKADADKYKNWYNADGLFIDEFTNKVGYESHYRDVTNYAKSVGMKMTLGNPGTDVPKSYIGTVDVINITEGRGYMPISWLQYCVQCSASSGWHYQYDKRNFAYIRYDISSLDTTFETESAKWVGLLYIHTGNDSNGRWFTVPSYFGTLIETLDR
ncbi:MAG: spherulation-specific family 4 protein, partial [Nitrososphaera sp.]|uniref:spherulation-specific family 4 protein n=1 Tax=Nitrososphaera sp. TaxID=1971748 RepID=UPI003D6E9C02